MDGPNKRYMYPPPSPQKWACQMKLVLLNYPWNQMDTPLSDPLDVSMTWILQVPGQSRKTQESPDFCVLHRSGNGQTCKNPVGRGKMIAHTGKFFPLWCAISNQKRTLLNKVSFFLSSPSIARHTQPEPVARLCEQSKESHIRVERQIQTTSACHHGASQTATVKVSSLRVTARYIVSRSNGSRPASVISRTRSARRIPCGVVAPAS